MRGHIPRSREISFTKKVIIMLINVPENELTLYEEIEEAKSELARL